jgi:hypothetical protein
MEIFGYVTLEMVGETNQHITFLFFQDLSKAVYFSHNKESHQFNFKVSQINLNKVFVYLLVRCKLLVLAV